MAVSGQTLSTLAMVSLLATGLLAQRPRQQITVPSLAETAANFKTPPREYRASQAFLGWRLEG